MRKNIVLEIEGNTIKKAVIERKGSSVFLRGITFFENENKDITRGEKGNITVLIPPRKTMIRYLELPSRDRQELKDMINFQLPRYLPYNFGDCIFDFRIVEEKGEGYSKVMVVCIQNQFFNEILRIAPRLNSVNLTGEAGIDFLDNLKKAREGLYMLIEISSEEVTLSISDSKVALFTRSLNPSFFIDEKAWSKGFEEIEKTSIAFSREFADKNIESIIVSGAGAYAPGFYNFLKGRSPHPVELFDPYGHIRLQDVKIEKLDKFSFHAIIGAGINTEKKRIDLISQEFISKKQMRLKKISTAYTLSLVFIIFLQISFILYKEIDKKKVYLSYLKTEIKKTRPEAKLIDDKEKRTSLIKKQLNMEGSCLDIVKEIYCIIPQDISINILIFEKDNFLSIRGVARTMGEVFNLMKKLEGSQYFVKVISEGTKMRNIKGEMMTDFQIRVMLK